MEGDENELTEVVLREEEAARSGAFGRSSFLLGALGLFIDALPHLSITLADRVRIGIPIAILTAVGATMWYRARHAHRYLGRAYDPRVARVLSSTAAVAALFLVYAVGVFSPVVVVVMLGLSIDPRDKFMATWISRGITVVYIALAVLVTAGVLADVGLWRVHTFESRAAMVVVTGAVMFMQTRFARDSRRSLEQAVARAKEMARVVRTREAQLDEAREILDVALRRGAEGRLTGRVLDGYRVGEIVGRGAMGEVYAATPEGGGQRVAIKVLRAFHDDSVAKRFLREAEIALKVRGPNLVDVHGSGRMDDGALYIVMELLVGSDLAAILRERASLRVPEVVVVVEQVARGLELLHGAGVIHRDLKPQNLFLPSGPHAEWKILDYGVSKVAGAGTMTHGDIIGTPAFMSPEQAEGGEIDARSDVFSLAAVAYRALTGRRPFIGSDVPQILYQVVHGTPMRMHEIDPTIPRAVESVIAAALAKHPADRYASAMELATALRRATISVDPTDGDATVVGPEP